MSKKPTRRSKKMLYEAECLCCWLRKEPNQCSVGTLGGNCIPCGESKPAKPLVPFDGFFTKDIGDHMLALEAQHDLDINAEGNILEFRSTDPTGFADSIQHQILGEVSLSNNDMRNQLDQKVLSHCVPKVSYRNPTTSVTRSALYARGYLSLLLPSDPVPETMSFSNSFRLSNVFLPRLHESIDQVTNAAATGRSHVDEAFRSEVIASVAILYSGLADAYNELKNGKVQPLCGGEKMAGLLTGRMESTMEHLIVLLYSRGINCDRKWASTLDGPLHDLRSNCKISVLRITTVKETGSEGARTVSTKTPVTMALSPPSTDEPTFDYPGRSTSHSPVDTSWVPPEAVASSTLWMEASTPSEIDPQTPTPFDFPLPSPLINRERSCLSPLSPSLPFGDATHDFHSTTKETTAQPSVSHRHSSSWNSGIMQPMIHNVNPARLHTYNNNMLSPARHQQRNLPPKMPSYVSTVRASYALAETPGEMASQVSAPSGSNHRTKWSEHPHTWRQS